MELQAIPDKPLKEGYTTGACATACVKAGLYLLLSGIADQKVQLWLPAGKWASFNLKSLVKINAKAIATVIKDAGDDPDVTHGAEIGVEVSLNSDGKVKFLQGEGVGKVTLPGLSLAVGEPAINPVPRKMMTEVVLELLREFGIDQQGVNIKVFVKNGKQLAKRTLNERIGIVGGISILGTTGVVKPFSASSYIASIEQGVDVAVANKIKELVLNSGARSEKYLRKLLPEQSEIAYIHYGNWIGEALRKIASSGIRKVYLGIMLGKAVKLAAGQFDLHSAKSRWQPNLVKEWARQAGYSDDEILPIDNLQMAGRLTEVFPFFPNEPFYQYLLFMCKEHCQTYLPMTDLELYLFNKEGKTIKFYST
ncbi:cobalt-precorrin-5B (C(1))-methyltransferase [Xanthovirga aplysinae]|uniref:cobalt-precorrin-5B (C(1))-methyltransferase n=1 Tax=Xanthovirga aplysinae TaxID=2529853 RepID=UPI0012BCB99C|nr:cobalt-precorrin-5B (C(1))-methyltransferase [Xanthovirga aplysinae]MTI33550.1 cobalt-precorrin-5B (C(1))-methyltransferase [Xanthovirga aplysinae]